MSKLYETITVHQTSDGKKFGSEQDAQNWGEWLEDCATANALLGEGFSLLDVLERAKARQPLNIWGYHDKDNEALAKITKDTALVISHWQCSDKPGYKVIELMSSGRLYVHGDAGSWSGSYGSMVSIADLLRYFRDTQARAGVEA